MSKLTMLPNKLGMGTMVDIEKITSMEIYMPHDKYPGCRAVYLSVEGSDEQIVLIMKRRFAYGLANVLMRKIHYRDYDCPFIEDYESYFTRNNEEECDVTNGESLKKEEVYCMGEYDDD